MTTAVDWDVNITPNQNSINISCQVILAMDGRTNEQRVIAYTLGGIVNHATAVHPFHLPEQLKILDQ